MNIESTLLINEWQLGQQLNIAVHKGTRDKFNLLLSLLSSNVQDFAQFSLAHSKQFELSTQALRDSFQLSDSQPLINEGISLQQADFLNQSLHDNRIDSIRLQYLLNNEAVLSRSYNPAIPDDIIDNISFLSQERLSEELAPQTLDDPTYNTKKKPPVLGVDYQLMQAYKALA